ncbi:phage tail tube protein [Enterovirga rhinocerotis]|uniref:Tail tube protein n=1 Tax=Enterovirga rhinocerotis TaxID=1339210 RepID=A0A4R7BWP3_9HYPH|nr:phage tail tube protein [Enterovirga rhinocerotis]TDR90294.1 hypothetical protein EV668_3140 [Enterovirga rhinocerotis]
MPFADHALTRIAYVAESAWGVTPATPTLKTLRTTRASGLRTNKATVESDELRADRNVADLIQVSQRASGEYPVEMSYGSFDDWLAAVLCGSWATNILKNGILRTSFTVEETREMGATDSFSRFTGAMLNTFSLDLRPAAKVEGSFGLMAQKETLATAIVTGATYTPASTEQIMNSSSHVASLTIPNVTSPKVMSLSLNVDNGMRERPVVGSLYSEEFGLGRCRVTGQMELYFSDPAIYQAVLDHGSGALSFTIGADANKKYTFNLPKVRFGDGNIPAGGNDDDVMITVPFTAIFDATAQATIVVTRAVA